MSTTSATTIGGRTKFPFTSTQWQELEDQALIYKYMAAGVPIPPDLLFTIKRSLDSSLSSKLFPYQPSPCKFTFPLLDSQFHWSQPPYLPLLSLLSRTVFEHTARKKSHICQTLLKRLKYRFILLGPIKYSLPFTHFVPIIFFFDIIHNLFVICILLSIYKLKYIVK